MIGFRRKSAKKRGLPPGTPVYTGERREEEIRITVIDYDAERFKEKTVASVEECLAYAGTPSVTWINVDGIHDAVLVEKLCTHYGLHPLAVEDVLSVGQRPKMEDFGELVFMVVDMLTYDVGRGELGSEQVSLVLGRNFVLSFQERPGDVFEPLRERLRRDKGRIRKAGSDYLAYSLLDAIVDGYFLVLEGLGERTEALEEELVRDPTPGTLRAIHALKRQAITIRRSVWPLREVLSALTKGGSRLVLDETGIYLRDVYDHTIEIIDTIESLRDLLAGMVDTYLSSVSNRMNEVMKVLTIIATIFIPLTFIAGVYGMNFKYMPEIEWPPAYFVVLGVMVAVAAWMLLFFRRKRWL